MKYFALIEGVNPETLDKFIRFYNDNHEVPCTIVINSRGGSGYIAETVVHMIGQMNDCTLIIHAAYSAAFEIAVEAKCKKILSKFSRGMMHLARLTVDMGVDGNPYYDEDTNHFKNFGVEKKLGDRLAKKIMTKEELIKFKKREEVWFDFKRMKEIFPSAEILK